MIRCNIYACLAVKFELVHSENSLILLELYTIRFYYFLPCCIFVYKRSDGLYDYIALRVYSYYFDFLLR